jgi:hypothetical protein
MSFTKKQKKIVVIILAFAYLYFFYVYNWKTSIPGIKSNSQKLSVASQELESLEKQLKNIQITESKLQSLQTANERYSDYIEESVDIVDVINYMERLEKLFVGKISGVNLAPPRLNARSTPNYYEVAINFRATLKYNELLALTAFVEGGTKMSKITRLTVTPEPFTAEERAVFGNQLPSIYRENWNLITNVGITLYALDQGEAELLYEVSKNKFERFGYFDGIAFVTPDLSEGGRVMNINLGEVPQGPLPPITNRQDIVITMASFLTGVPNFSVRGIDTGNNEGFDVRIRERQEVTIRFNNYMYSLEAIDPSGIRNAFTGNFPGRNVALYVRDLVPEIQENKDIGMDIRIVNESDYQVAVSLSRKSGRVRILDRDYQVVLSTNQRDKIFMI